MANDWSDTEVLVLREMFNAGIPDDEIADCLKRSHIAVKVKRQRLGITGDHNARRISNRNRAKMAFKKTGEESHSWKGGRRINFAGYVELFNPFHPRSRKNGYVFEHIIIMEKIIGRELLPGEEVHHKDRDKQNNSPENLQLVSHSQHSSIHGALKERKGQYIECPVCCNKFYAKPSHVSKRTTCSIKCAGELFKRYYTGKPINRHISELEKFKALKEVSRR